MFISDNSDIIHIIRLIINPTCRHTLEFCPSSRYNEPILRFW